MEDNNGFENFEDQGRYIAIDEKTEEPADKYAKLAKRILIIEVVEVCVVMLLSSIFFESLRRYYFVRAAGIVIFVCHIISLRYAVIGYRIKKTKMAKEVIELHKTIPLVCFVMIILYLLAAYLIWSLVVGFLPERISFFDWLF